MTQKNIRNVVSLFLTAATAAVSMASSSCSDWVDPPDLAAAPLTTTQKSPCAGATADASARPVCFKTDIRPLMNRTNFDLSGHGCKACHYPIFWGDKGTDSTGLDLSSLGSLRKGGFHSQGTMVVPGDPKSSAFVQKLRGQFYIGAHMPKDGPPFWSESQIQLVERWISEGAHGDDNE
jgi:hypothetical protein